MAMHDAKSVVRRFNEEVIAGGDRAAFDALMAPDFVNRSAPPGAPNDGESMWNTFATVLRPALEGLAVVIHDQIAEGDKVVTRKAFKATHTGPFMDVPATGKSITFPVVDIVRLRDGKYIEHWGIRDTYSVLRQLTTESA